MAEQSLEAHVAELRTRLFHVLAAFVVFSAAAFYYSAEVLAWLQQDLAFDLHALTAYETFYTQLMIALLIGATLTLPVLLYELLRFAKPGMKPREYRTVRNFLPFSYLLFLVGAAFAYQFIVKTALGFFQAVTQASDVTAVWGLQNTIGFALKLSALTGVLFQLPIIAVVLGRVGLVSAAQMRQYRSYVIVAVLILAAVATPPDVVSQLLVVVPVIGLYEGSIVLVAWLAD